MFELLGEKIEAGTVKQLQVPVFKTVDGQSVMIPVTVVNGAQDGPVLLLDGCIHGDEPDGPVAILRTVKKLDPAKLKGTVVAVPAVNVPAFASGKRGNPRDEHNYDLNRIYPGKPGEFMTGRLAHIHFTELLSKANLELSIHGGGGHSFMCPAIFQAGTPESKELAKAMGKDWPIVMQSLGDASPMGQGKKIGVAGITVEIGGICGCVPQIFDQTVKTLEKAFLNVMYHYGMLEGKAEYCDKWYVGHQATVYAEADGLIDPVYGNKLGQWVEEGEPILRTIDLYGNVVQEAKAPCAGIPFGIHTQPSVSTGEWMIFHGAVKEAASLD